MLGATLLRTGQDEVDDTPARLEPVEEEPALPAAHVDFTTLVLFNVTAPFLARSLPLTTELPSSVIDVKASTFPIRFVPVPRVAEEPTCQ